MSRQVRDFAQEFGVSQILQSGLDNGPLSSAQVALVLAAPCEWSNRMQGTLGYAYRQPRLIRLNDLMLPSRPHAHQARETFLHEVAHIAAEIAAPGASHGYYWGYFMIAFGLRPTRCHAVPVQELRAARAQSKPKTLSLDDL